MEDVMKLTISTTVAYMYTYQKTSFTYELRGFFQNTNSYNREVHYLYIRACTNLTHTQ